MLQPGLCRQGRQCQALRFILPRVCSKAACRHILELLREGLICSMCSGLRAVMPHVGASASCAHALET